MVIITTTDKVVIFATRKTNIFSRPGMVDSCGNHSNNSTLKIRKESIILAANHCALDIELMISLWSQQHQMSEVISS